MCNEVSRAVNSLGGNRVAVPKRGRGLFDNFNFHSAKFINEAAKGFIFLRQATPPRIAASKLLIRPVLEIKFRLVPDTFTGVTFTATQIGGASGFTPSGSGNINDTVTMPAGSKITYKAHGRISASATGSI